MRKVVVAATQMSCGKNRSENIEKADKMVREAAAKGANIIVLQELFETEYFCQKENPEFFKLATTLEENPAVNHFRKVAKELDVVIPVSFFEKSGNLFYNAIAIIDADGSILGFYRKSHIPYGALYMEKYYFRPGNTGFQVWDTKYAKIGVGICWDQWFSESGRVMALKGAELLLYPTANGDDPLISDIKGALHWKNCMMGQAVANTIPVIASNRTGIEKADDTQIGFFGFSFIMDETGELVQYADKEDEYVLTAEFDLDAIEESRNAWGLFRDRRPDLYKKILSLDGECKK